MKLREGGDTYCLYWGKGAIMAQLACFQCACLVFCPNRTRLSTQGWKNVQRFQRGSLFQLGNRGTEFATSRPPCLFYSIYKNTTKVGIYTLKIQRHDKANAPELLRSAYSYISWFVLPVWHLTIIILYFSCSRVFFAILRRKDKCNTLLSLFSVRSN
jgi:hypothetical protein